MQDKAWQRSFGVLKKVNPGKLEHKFSCSYHEQRNEKKCYEILGLLIINQHIIQLKALSPLSQTVAGTNLRHSILYSQFVGRAQPVP